jgi:hypothetical protein
MGRHAADSCIRDAARNREDCARWMPDQFYDWCKFGSCGYTGTHRA